VGGLGQVAWTLRDICLVCTCCSNSACSIHLLARRACDAALQNMPHTQPKLGVLNLVGYTNTNLHNNICAHAAAPCLAPAWHLCRRSVPALLDGYRTCRTLGIVASSSSLQRAWASTSAAATSGAPGSYLAFELSTSDDGWAWQPVQFRQSDFGTLAGPAGQEGLLRRVRGVYEPRLQGRLAAAGSGSLEDNPWLLGLADKVLEVRGGWWGELGCTHCYHRLQLCCICCLALLSLLCCEFAVGPSCCCHCRCRGARICGPTWCSRCSRMPG
jgi:hypothetical protein